jgi:potassium-transporting ATPase potassium-binding subunit
MTLNGWLQILIYIAIVVAIAKPVGLFMAHVFNGERTFLHPLIRLIERLIYRLTGVDEKREMHWTEYAVAMLLFSAVSMLLLYFIQRLQGYLPFNPQKLPGVDSSTSATGGFVGSAFNTAASFTSNTNWQSYVPEVTMSYFTQMAGLAYHNFASAATGIVLAIAFIRGIARREMKTIGNFWVDFVRCNLYVLLPVCILGALLLVSQGVVQNLRPYDTATLVEAQTIEVDRKDANGNVLTNPDGTNQKESKAVTQQTIAQEPVASQEFIKELGTNGSGFFNTNSAHPFENPTPFTNLIEMLAIFSIGAGLTYTLGRMTGSQKHGWAVLASMVLVFLGGVFVAYWAEARGNPILANLGTDP